MIEPPRARCSAMGQERWAELSLMAEDPPEVGDYVLIQFGFVQRKVDAVEAQESLRLFRDILTTLDAEG